MFLLLFSYYRLRKDNARLTNERSTLEKQLLTTREQLNISEEEMDALEKECLAKISDLEGDVRLLLDFYKCFVFFLST